MRSLAGKLIRLMSWLCFEHEWAQWELLTVAAIVLLLLLFIIRQLRKGAVARTQAILLPERSPIIGVRLADHQHGYHEIEGSQRAAASRRDHAKQKSRKTTRHQEKLNRQIEQLQREVAERKQVEARLGRRLAEFKKADKTRRQDDVMQNQADRRVGQQVAELTAANKQLREEIVRHRDYRADLEKQLAGLKAAHELSRRPQLEPKPPESIPVKSIERKSKAGKRGGPLNIEELSRLAELSKRLASRRPR